MNFEIGKYIRKTIGYMTHFGENRSMVKVTRVNSVPRVWCNGNRCTNRATAASCQS